MEGAWSSRTVRVLAIATGLILCGNAGAVTPRLPAPLIECDRTLRTITIDTPSAAAAATNLTARLRVRYGFAYRHRAASTPPAPPPLPTGLYNASAPPRLPGPGVVDISARVDVVDALTGRVLQRSEVATAAVVLDGPGCGSAAAGLCGGRGVCVNATRCVCDAGFGGVFCGDAVGAGAVDGVDAAPLRAGAAAAAHATLAARYLLESVLPAPLPGGAVFAPLFATPESRGASSRVVCAAPAAAAVPTALQTWRLAQVAGGVVWEAGRPAAEWSAEGACFVSPAPPGHPGAAATRGCLAEYNMSAFGGTGACYGRNDLVVDPAAWGGYRDATAPALRTLHNALGRVGAAVATTAYLANVTVHGLPLDAGRDVVRDMYEAHAREWREGPAMVVADALRAAVGLAFTRDSPRVADVFAPFAARVRVALAAPRVANRSATDDDDDDGNNPHTLLADITPAAIAAVQAEPDAAAAVHVAHAFVQAAVVQLWMSLLHLLGDGFDVEVTDPFETAFRLEASVRRWGAGVPTGPGAAGAVGTAEAHPAAILDATFQSVRRLSDALAPHDDADVVRCIRAHLAAFVDYAPVFAGCAGCGAVGVDAEGRRVLKTVPWGVAGVLSCLPDPPLRRARAAPGAAAPPAEGGFALDFSDVRGATAGAVVPVRGVSPFGDFIAPLVGDVDDEFPHAESAARDSGLQDSGADGLPASLSGMTWSPGWAHPSAARVMALRVGASGDALLSHASSPTAPRRGAAMLSLADADAAVDVAARARRGTTGLQAAPPACAPRPGSYCNASAGGVGGRSRTISTPCATKPYGDPTAAYVAGCAWGCVARGAAAARVYDVDDARRTASCAAVPRGYYAAYASGNASVTPVRSTVTPAARAAFGVAAAGGARYVAPCALPAPMDALAAAGVPGGGVSFTSSGAVVDDAHSCGMRRRVGLLSERAAVLPCDAGYAMTVRVALPGGADTSTVSDAAAAVAYPLLSMVAPAGGSNGSTGAGLATHMTWGLTRAEDDSPGPAWRMHLKRAGSASIGATLPGGGCTPPHGNNSEAAGAWVTLTLSVTPRHVEMYCNGVLFHAVAVPVPTGVGSCGVAARGHLAVGWYDVSGADADADTDAHGIPFHPPRTLPMRSVRVSLGTDGAAGVDVLEDALMRRVPSDSTSMNASTPSTTPGGANATAASAALTSFGFWGGRERGFTYDAVPAAMATAAAGNATGGGVRSTFFGSIDGGVAVAVAMAPSAAGRGAPAAAACPPGFYSRPHSDGSNVDPPQWYATSVFDTLGLGAAWPVAHSPAAALNRTGRCVPCPSGAVFSQAPRRGVASCVCGGVGALLPAAASPVGAGNGTTPQTTRVCGTPLDDEDAPRPAAGQLGCPWLGDRPRDVAEVSLAGVANMLAAATPAPAPGGAANASVPSAIDVIAWGWTQAASDDVPYREPDTTRSADVTPSALYLTPFTTTSNISITCTCDAPSAWCVLRPTRAAGHVPNGVATHYTVPGWVDADALTAFDDGLQTVGMRRTGAQGAVGVGVPQGGNGSSTPAGAGIALHAEVFTAGASIPLAFLSHAPAAARCWVRARSAEAGRQVGGWCGVAVDVHPQLPRVRAASVSPRNESFATIYETLPLAVGGYVPHGGLFADASADAAAGVDARTAGALAPATPSAATSVVHAFTAAVLASAAHAAALTDAWRGLLARMEIQVMVLTVPQRVRAAAASANGRYLPPARRRWQRYANPGATGAVAVTPPPAFAVGSWSSLLVKVVDPHGTVRASPVLAVTYAPPAFERLLPGAEVANATTLVVDDEVEEGEENAETVLADRVMMGVAVGLAGLWLCVVAGFVCRVLWVSRARHAALRDAKMKKRKWVTAPTPDADGGPALLEDSFASGSQGAFNSNTPARPRAITTVFGPNGYCVRSGGLPANACDHGGAASSENQREEGLGLLAMAAATPLPEGSEEDADAGGNGRWDVDAGAGAGADGGGIQNVPVGGNVGNYKDNENNDDVTFAPTFGSVWYMSQADIALGRSFPACQTCYAKTAELHRVPCEVAGEYQWVCPMCVSAIRTAAGRGLP